MQIKHVLAILVGVTLLPTAACTPEPGGGDDAPDEDGLPPFNNGVFTLSGAAEAGFVDGSWLKSRFNNPVNVIIGPDGKLIVADFDNDKLRVVSPDTGKSTTLISQPGFRRPFGMVLSGSTLYVSTDCRPNGDEAVCDGFTDRIAGTLWRVDISARTATVIAMNLGRPRSLAMLPNGKIAMADYQHHVVQMIDPSSGAVTPLAGAWDDRGMVDGCGGEARFASAYGLVVKGGVLIMADHENHRLRQIGLDGCVTTMAGIGTAGFADGAMGSAMFNKPQAMTIASNGDIYMTDIDNFRIRKITAAGVETVAGNGKSGHTDSDDKLAAQFHGLEGLAVTADGSMLYVADGGRGEPVPFNFIRGIKLK